ncbi:7253_t:CDS:2 [Paraglomus occultum]|uniref:7253_t:CDS:1 n=1 Tax=Paraglomus occultum TaxID=144539 RepID=A0A9N9AZN3_9GLOM|nr:7253_t:CDS:2 [Paraglomus occultum]
MGVHGVVGVKIVAIKKVEIWKEGAAVDEISKYGSNYFDVEQRKAKNRLRWDR